jgi:hypothetical protein
MAKGNIPSSEKRHVQEQEEERDLDESRAFGYCRIPTAEGRYLNGIGL